MYKLKKKKFEDPATIPCRITNKKYCNPAKCKYAHELPLPSSLGKALKAVNSWRARAATR